MRAAICSSGSRTRTVSSSGVEIGIDGGRSGGVSAHLCSTATKPSSCRLDSRRRSDANRLLTPVGQARITDDPNDDSGNQGVPDQDPNSESQGLVGLGR